MHPEDRGLEIELHLQRIELLRDMVSELLAATPVEALNWLPGDGKVSECFNSLAVLATHIAGTEHYWIAEVIGKRPSVRDREAEFAARASNNRPLLEMLELTGRETREIFTGLEDSDLNRLVEVEGENPSILWCLMQVAAHTAIHYGHMQITYQLWNNGKMFNDVRWKSMLPRKDKA
jgi:uncharacterized damage-inducible protein DinB